MKDAFDQWWEWANKVPLGMDPTGEKPCQREEETKPTRLAEICSTITLSDLRAIIKKLRRKLN